MGEMKRGPKTEAGKLRSSRNATRHGLLSSTIVLEGESHRRFAKLVSQFYEELQPVGEVQRQIVETAAAARWRLLRIWGLEKAGIEDEIRLQDPNADPTRRAAMALKTLAERSRFLDLMNRYEVALDRQFSRSLARLRALQNGNYRGGAEEGEGEENVDV
jgi:hypothetical protein